MQTQAGSQPQTLYILQDFQDSCAIMHRIIYAKMFVRTCYVCIQIACWKLNRTSKLRIFLQRNADIIGPGLGSCWELQNGSFPLGFWSCLDLLGFSLQIWLALGILWQNPAFSGLIRCKWGQTSLFRGKSGDSRASHPESGQSSQIWGLQGIPGDSRGKLGREYLF